MNRKVIHPGSTASIASTALTASTAPTASTASTASTTSTEPTASTASTTSTEPTASTASPAPTASTASTASTTSTEPTASTASPASTASWARPAALLALGALGALLISTPALALPPANADPGGDPAPKPLLLRPVPAPQPVAAAPADTVALLPPGQYLLRLTLKGETLERPVKIVRGGTAVTAALGGTDTLSGTLTPAGQLQLAGGNATDRIELAANVTGGRASGQAQLGRGGNRMNASFTLDPLAGASKMKEYGAPAPRAGDGFFDRLAKAWNCLKNWSTC